MKLGGHLSVIRASENPKRLVLEVLVENDGEILSSAHELNVTRQTLYKEIRRLKLWPALTRIRREVAARRK